MSDVVKALVIVLSINVLFFLGQFAMNDINPTGTKFYDCEGNIMSEFELSNCKGAYFEVDQSYGLGNLPTAESGVSPETGNIFTDIFTTAKNWLLQKSGLGYILSILGAPVTFLSSIGLPNAFVFAIGTLWYAITFFLIIAWLLGK